MLSECCQKSGSEFTSFIISQCSGNPLYEFNVKTVKNLQKTLVQDPSVTFVLNFEPSRDCTFSEFISATTGNKGRLKTPCHIHTYDMSIMFEDNNNRTVDKSVYDIILNAAVEENGHCYHKQLFSYKKVCNDNKIDLPFQVLYFTKFEEIKLLHLCITMRRSVCSSNPCVAREECHLGKFLYNTLGKRKIDDDVTLVVGSEVFQAHKAILSDKSPVFKAMFSNDMMENQKDLVRIDNYEPHIVREMLYYMYTSSVGNMSQNVYELFKIAHQYDISHLCKECEEYLESNMNHCTVLSTLKIANQYNLEKLKTDVMAYLDSREERLAGDNEFLAALPSNLEVCTAAYFLRFCAKYNLNELESKVFDYIYEHKKEMARNQEFLDLYDTHAELMREFFKHLSLR